VDQNVFDEMHEYITAEYRDTLRRRLRAYQPGMPVLFLTATLPKQMEITLRAKIDIPQSVQTIRLSVDRPNIRYRIIKFLSKSEMRETFERDVKLVRNYLNGTERIIIFTMTKSEGKC